MKNTSVKKLVGLCLLAGLVGCGKSNNVDAGAEGVDALKSGVTLSPNSSFSRDSFASSFASFTPTGSGCSAQYTAVLASDPQWDSSVEFVFSPAPELNHEYALAPPSPPPTPNFLEGNGLGIQVNVNGIETPDYVDRVTSGTVTVSSLTGNLAFEFSIVFADGKTLQGEFNLPLQAGHCPPPM